ncbi:MAG TPA: phosphodiester glycosidase family protein, partial [Chitinophagaceae bacterium]|nr:phosphodiester glycosidase family protein [Chitinophagaceae bacterium]
YITKDKKAGICQSESISQVKNIAWATQSGPMLLVNKKIHPEFSPSSASKYIRNGVGILPDQEVVFLISTSEVTMYEFARYFQELGCTEALYLDGFVSRIWWPEKKIRPMDMDFGVMISVSEKRNNDLHHSDEITTK